MVNPMHSLPGYGEILKERCKLSTKDEDRCIGDLVGAVLDYLIGKAWSFLGLFENEEKKHREGLSIMEVQEFLDWAMVHLIEDMEWKPEELDEVFERGVQEFFAQEDEE